MSNSYIDAQIEPPRKTERHLAFLVAITAFSSLNPYYLWGNTQAALAVALALSLLVLPLCPPRQNLLNISLALGVATLSFLYSQLNGSSPLGSLFISIFCLIIALGKRNTTLVALAYFNLILAIAFAPGILLWITHHLFADNTFLTQGIIPRGNIPNPVKIAAGIDYAHYPGSIVSSYMLQDTMYRFHGPFDEPGVVGTVSALALAAQRFSLRRHSNKIIFIAGLVSFSLAFYLMAFVYLLLRYHRNIPIVLSLFASAFVLFYASIHNDLISTKIADRVLALTDPSTFGKSRASEEFDTAFDEWSRSSLSVIAFGSNRADETGSSTWKLIPFRSGLLGSFILIAIFLLLAMIRLHPPVVTPHILAFLLVFSLSVYQRPDILAPTFLLIFSAALIPNASTSTKRALRELHRLRMAQPEP